jgi:hypothetical protein
LRVQGERLRQILRRLATFPFEGLIAGLVIISGSAGLFGIGDVSVLDALLPRWLFVMISVLYVLSGLLMVAGLGLARGNLEAGGLIALVASTIIRFIGIGSAVGYTDERVILLLTLYVLVAASSTVRLRTILHGEKIVRVDGPPGGG